MQTRDKLKKGDSFTATLRQCDHSKTLLGKEKAGQVFGPFTATSVKLWRVDSADFRFSYADFFIEKTQL